MPSFPNSVWNGQSGVREDNVTDRPPDNRDWNRIIDELAATQRYLLNLASIIGVRVPNTLAGYDDNGNFADITIGDNLSLVDGELSSTGGGGGGSSPGGSNGQIQINNNGALAGLRGNALINDINGSLDAVAIGNGSYALGEQSLAVGYQCIASTDKSIAGGYISIAGDPPRACTIDGTTITLSSTVDLTNWLFDDGPDTLVLSQLSGGSGPTIAYAQIASVAYTDGHTVLTLVSSVTNHTTGYVNVRDDNTGVFAFGSDCHAMWPFSFALGASCYAGSMTVNVGAYAFALGFTSTSSGNVSFSLGNGSVASGNNSFAQNYSTVASGNSSHAEGNNSIASGDSSHAEGRSTASGIASHSEGNTSEAQGNYSHAEGNGSLAVGVAAHSSGLSTLALGNHSLSGGNASVAGSDDAIALGYQSLALGQQSLAIGYQCTASTDYSVALGYQCVAGDPPRVCTISGTTVTISGGDYTAWFYVYIDGELVLSRLSGGSGPTIAYGTVNAINYDSESNSTIITLSESVTSHTSGYVNERDDYTRCFALGSSCNSYGSNSFASGYGSNAINGSDHAQGSLVTAEGGGGSHAEGNSTHTLGPSAHAEGQSTLASGLTAHAEGNSTVASGNYSHVEGDGATASGECSYAGGRNATASLPLQWCRGDGHSGQYGDIFATGLTSDATPVTLLIDASTNITITNYHYLGFLAFIGGLKTDFSVGALFIRQGVIINNNGTLSISTINTVGTDINPSSWSVSITADSEDGALAVTVTGEDSVEWKVRIQFIEMW